MHVSWTSEALNYFNYRSFEGHQYTEIAVWYIENVIEVFHGLILLLFLKCTNLPSHSLSFSSIG